MICGAKALASSVHQPQTGCRRRRLSLDFGSLRPSLVTNAHFNRDLFHHSLFWHHPSCCTTSRVLLISLFGSLKLSSSRTFVLLARPTLSRLEDPRINLNGNDGAHYVWDVSSRRRLALCVVVLHTQSQHGRRPFGCRWSLLLLLLLEIVPPDSILLFVFDIDRGGDTGLLLLAINCSVCMCVLCLHLHFFTTLFSSRNSSLRSKFVMMFSN